jgi:mannitol-specific phosphotransferase system IIBC component
MGYPKTHQPLLSILALRFLQPHPHYVLAQSHELFLLALVSYAIGSSIFSHASAAVGATAAAATIPCVAILLIFAALTLVPFTLWEAYKHYNERRVDERKKGTAEHLLSYGYY